jgi:hypothetical protein
MIAGLGWRDVSTFIRIIWFGVRRGIGSLFINIGEWIQGEDYD